MTDVAIVGAGFSGTLLALHLLRRCPPGSTVTLIERAVQFGRGAAYSTGNPSHLLNVPAGRMSAFHDRPHDFLDWLKQQSDPCLSQPLTADSFVPRQMFGDYIRHLLNREIKSGAQGSDLRLVRGDALGVDEAAGGVTVRLDRGRTVEADLAVLAIGNFPPEPPPVADPAFYNSGLYRPDPWAGDAFSELDPDRPVLLIGTGLTMVDAAISLIDRGHRGPIHALSRRGLLPQRHTPSVVAPSPRAEPMPTTLVALTRFLRREADRADAEGANWRAIVDALRPFTGDVWAELSTADRARFLRHMRPWWEVHRHRMASPVADKIEAAVARGQLDVRAGRILSFDASAGEVAVRYRLRHGDGFQTVTAARVVNCSGPACDYARISHPLIRGMLESGMIRPDPLGLGLDVTRNCALKNRQGAISGWLFAAGPVTKAAFWEMTAVPDIRRQCEYLANHLAGLPKGRPVLASNFSRTAEPRAPA
jgi:uncharacterized NAD(P)/FAD-binding protein YdhS